MSMETAAIIASGSKFLGHHKIIFCCVKLDMFGGRLVLLVLHLQEQ